MDADLPIQTAVGIQQERKNRHQRMHQRKKRTAPDFCLKQRRTDGLTSRSCRRKIRRSGDGFIFRERILTGRFLQSATSDTYYQNHMADGQEGEAGALYIEIPNQTNLCDFNTVIHGKDQKEGDLFYELHKFEEPDFFNEHEALYIYTPDNVYTYSIYAAYYDEGSDILRRYDYTTYQGCNAYLADYYDRRDMTMNKRDGWEDITAGHFLLTLDGTTTGDRQFVVMAGLVNAGVASMDRMIFDGTDFVYDFEDEE